MHSIHIYKVCSSNTDLIILILDLRLLIGAVNKRTSTLDLKFFTNYAPAEGANSEYIYM